jgi:phenylacetate-coenzyme A ligase PaaK-like adenylate-forming protein
MLMIPELADRFGWSRARLDAHRVARLRELAGFASGRSSWHRERLAGVDLGRLDLESLVELPPMTKADLMEHFDEILTDRRLSLGLVEAYLETVSTGSYLLDRYTAITSAGSTGRRGVFVYDWDGWALFWLGVFRHLLRWIDEDPEFASRPAVLATVMAAHFTHGTAAMNRTFTSPRLSVHRLPVTLPIEELVAGLNECEPDFLMAYPSALHLLACEALAGRLRIGPRGIRCGAEPLLLEIRALAEEAWGVPIGNVWGTSEAGGTAVACEHARMHLSEDLVIVEPVDEEGRPVAPGVRAAKVYVTNLYNRVLPLIRYEITDEVTVLGESCPCGSVFASVADIEGRLDDVFVYDGRRVHPHLFRSALGARAGIVEYQVRQTPRGATIAVHCNAAVDLDVMAREIEQGLALQGIGRPDVQVTAVGRLERDPGPAKLKRFVPLPVEGRPEPQIEQNPKGSGIARTAPAAAGSRC